MLLVFMVFNCYYYEIFLRINIQAACANLLWACGCWCYFTPLRIVESGLDVTLPQMCCSASRIIRTVQLILCGLLNISPGNL
ncbi:hypothetical protein AAVH_14676 [Aphelenchoides avenae]|nr:hypothetical protein AAVH_17996 [Aphelenchus avenae]KAH7717945.1 hypothetical protein AAVH_14676 [Aphelenchus avenae]